MSGTLWWVIKWLHFLSVFYVPSVLHWRLTVFQVINVLYRVEHKSLEEVYEEHMLNHPPEDDYEIVRGPRPWEDHPQKEQMLKNKKQPKVPITYGLWNNEHFFSATPSRWRQFCASPDLFLGVCLSVCCPALSMCPPLQRFQKCPRLKLMKTMLNKN